MTKPEAQLLVALLNAGFPRMTLEPASEQVYVAALMKLRNPELANQAISGLIEQSEDFPSIARLRETYGALRRVQAEAKERAERDGYDRSPQALAQIEVLARKLGVRETTSAEYPPFDEGQCDDCGKTAGRARYGRFALCKTCVGSRLRAAAILEKETA